MFYIILIAAVIFASIFIFRDDHDRSYEKREKSQRPVSRLQPEKPAARQVTAPRDKTVVQVPKPPTQETPIQPSPTQNLDWSYLFTLDYDDSIVGDTMDTEIAGMRYYCTMADVGLVNGTVRPEPGNPHDIRAQVVIRADGKKLGYIPRRDLDDYEEFNEDDLTCPFVGRVVVDHNGYMKADIRVALPESLDFVKEELLSYEP